MLSLAQFLTLKFVHPVRTKRWRAISLPVAMVWTASIGVAAWTDFAPMPALTIVVALTSIYLLVAGVAQQVIYDRGHVR